MRVLWMTVKHCQLPHVHTVTPPRHHLAEGGAELCSLLESSFLESGEAASTQVCVHMGTIKYLLE